MRPQEDKKNAFGISVGICDIAVAKVGQLASGRCQAAPPAALLPAIPGERIEAASFDRIDPRGSGLAWPPEARVSIEGGSARFPAAAAWSMLDEADSRWRWNMAASQARPEEAIAAIAVAACASDPHSRPHVALAVPNTLDLAAQDALIRQMRLRGMEPVLIWRPVAAALSWLERNSLPDAEVASDEELGHLLCVHLGLGVFEADILELRRYSDRSTERVWVLPARRQPRVRSLRKVGLQAVEGALCESFGDTSLAWNAMWASSAIRAHLFEAARSQRVPSTPRDTPHTTSFYPAQSMRAVGRPSINHLTQLRLAIGGSDAAVRRPDLFMNPQASLEDWLMHLKSVIEGLRITGVVVTGELGGSIDGELRIADQILVQLLPSRSSALLLEESADEPVNGLIAQGAAAFLQRHLARQPTYLDTLPSIEAIVVRSGEPYWQDLIDRTERFVLGGRVSRYEPTELNLGVRAEEQQLTLDVAQEGFETVRKVTHDFRSTRSQDVRIRLRIEIAPAQGNPRVEVIPDNPSVFDGQRIYLDWDKAEDTGKGKDERLESLPRTNPHLEPRHSSTNCWLGRHPQQHSARDAAQRVLRLLDQNRPRELAQALKHARRALWDKDSTLSHRSPPVHATAFDSDGQLPPIAANREYGLELIDALDGMLAKRLDAVLMREVLRVLGYCSAQSPNLTDLLKAKWQALARMRGKELQAMLVACGNCLREPSDIRLFAESMAKNLSAANPSAPNDWMRALCRMLMYRMDAAREIPTDQCAMLTTHCFRIVKVQVEQESEAKYLYRHGTLCIAYLLRRRRYDDTFLPPNGNLAVEIKTFMQRTIKGMQTGRIAFQTGFIDLPLVTQTIIDYINRKGTGRLVLLD